MVVTCCVTGCSNRCGRDTVTFHRVPAILMHQGKKTEELTTRKRNKWMARINRKDWNPLTNSFVCLKYFISGLHF